MTLKCYPEEREDVAAERISNPKIFARAQRKYLEFSSEAFNMPLSEPGRQGPICHGRENSTG